jgi:hypothetical protein
MLTSMSRKVRPVGEKPRGLQAPRPTASRSVCWLKLGATWVPLTRAEAPEEITRFLAARVAH